ncbi:MAG TPA: hypothetical protein ENJ09_00090 [Planctomycetes bacterium]|nr:hypothetical protein [Planctomycetota bacterium]
MKNTLRKSRAGWLGALATVLASGLVLSCSGDAPEILEPEGSAPAAATQAAAADGTVTVGPMHFELPEGWVAETPANSMRAAQFRIPGGDGTSLVIFFFGVGGGGGVEANMDRWVGQVTQPDGGDSKAVAKRTDEERGAIRLHHLDVTGNYGGMGGETHTNWRLLGTVVECDGGPYFFKLTGPAESVEAAKADFERLLASITIS